MSYNLVKQDQFEKLWFNRDPARPPVEGQRPSDRVWIVYFTAKWCGPCKKLNMGQIETLMEAKKVPLWRCDVDDNEYTPGYCQVKVVPTFICFKPGTVVSTLQSADTPTVMKWFTSLKL